MKLTFVGDTVIPKLSHTHARAHVCAHVCAHARAHTQTHGHGNDNEVLILRSIAMITYMLTT